MKTVNISKDKLGQVISDVEKLVSDVESLMEDQDQIAKQRMNDIQEEKVEAKSEEELDLFS